MREYCHYIEVVDAVFESHFVTNSLKNANLNNVHSAVGSSLFGVAVERRARGCEFCGFASRIG